MYRPVRTLAMVLLPWILAAWIGSTSGYSLRSDNSGTSYGDDTSHPLHQQYQAIVDEYVGRGLPGLAVLVRTRQEGTWIGTGGFARIEDRTPVRSGSLFHSASMCKTYTATAILMLQDQGLVDLDVAIDRYLPDDIADRIANGHTATVRHLLSHSSGIPNYDMVRPWWNNPLVVSWQDELESVFDRPAEFTPGSRFEYCNTNYKLLAVIIDQLTGSHADFFSERIFHPLGLDNTYYKNEARRGAPPDLVDVYFDRFGDGYLENGGSLITTIEYNHAYGDGGMIADVADYARFIEAVLSGKLLRPGSIAEMTTPAFPENSWLYGLGIEIQETNHGYAFGHGGRGFAGSAEMHHLPDAGVTICFATNYGYRYMTEAQRAVDEILDVVLAAVPDRGL